MRRIAPLLVILALATAPVFAAGLPVHRRREDRKAVPPWADQAGRAVPAAPLSISFLPTGAHPEQPGCAPPYGRTDRHHQEASD